MDMSSMSDTSTMDMSSVTMEFFTSTSTPLYTAMWTPKSAGAYAGTCIFLVILSVIFRALFTAKFFLEARALKAALRRRYVVVADQQSASDKAFAGGDASSMTAILTTNGVQENVRVLEAPASQVQPWRFSVDLPRALLMTIIAAVGYLLMLAVMTYNVGYFLSVLAGAFVGEAAFGRFNHGGTTV